HATTSSGGGCSSATTSPAGPRTSSIRPYGVSSGPLTTSPPSSATRGAIASASSTPTYQVQAAGTSPAPCPYPPPPAAGVPPTASDVYVKSGALMSCCAYPKTST